MLRYGNDSLKIKVILILIGISIISIFYALFNITLNYIYSTKFIFLFGVIVIAIAWVFGIVGMFYYFQRYYRKYYNIIKFNKIKSYYSGSSLLVIDLVIISMLVFFLQSDASKFIKFSTSFVSMATAFCTMLVSIGIENYYLKIKLNEELNKKLQLYLKNQINLKKHMEEVKEKNKYKKEVRDIRQMCKYLDYIRKQSKIYTVVNNKKKMYNKPLNYMNHLNLNKRALSTKCK